MLASACNSVLAVNAWFVKPLVNINADIVACPAMLAVFVIFRKPTFVAPKPRKFASAVRVTASVPLVVSGEPETENSPGTDNRHASDRASATGGRGDGAVALIVIVELSTLTNPSVEAVAAFVDAKVFVPRNAARPLASDRPFVAACAVPAASYKTLHGKPFVTDAAAPAGS